MREISNSRVVGEPAGETGPLVPLGDMRQHVDPRFSAAWRTGHVHPEDGPTGPSTYLARIRDLIDASGQRHITLCPVPQAGWAEPGLPTDVDVDRVKLLRRVHLREVLTDHAQVDPDRWASVEDPRSAGDALRSVGEADSHTNEHRIAYLQGCRHPVMLGVPVPPRKKQTAPAKAAAKKVAKVEPCVYHPPGRIIGGHCMVCDHPVAKK